MDQISRTEEMIFMMKKIGLNLTAQLEMYLKQKDITGVQVYFLVYILRHHPDGTYLTELCREIGVSKATLSALIKKLREKGYLYFLPEPDDIRKKKVIPTEKLAAEREELLEKAGQMEAGICGVLDPKEQDQFWNLERKLLNQLSGGECDENSENNRQEVYLP